MLYIRVCPGLSFATKRIGPPCCTLFTLFTCYSLLFILSQNYLLSTISVIAEKTLLKAAYHLPQKDWATLMHFCYHYHYLLVTNYLAIKLVITYNFSACREYLAGNYLSVPSALVGFYTLTYRKDYIDPLYLWAMN